MARLSAKAGVVSPQSTAHFGVMGLWLLLAVGVRSIDWIVEIIKKITWVGPICRPNIVVLWRQGITSFRRMSGSARGTGELKGYKETEIHLLRRSTRLIFFLSSIEIYH